jgi:hypothetical protein
MVLRLPGDITNTKTPSLDYMQCQWEIEMIPNARWPQQCLLPCILH